jgi:parvulin-like peptidyl-prolyl isomerase
MAFHLLTDEADPASGPAELDRVKSRLLDALVEEKALLFEAERRGFEVSGREIDAYFGAGPESGPDSPRLSPEGRRGLVRQRLMAQKLQESVEDGIPSPSDEEVIAHIHDSDGRLAPRKRVRLRALRFESAADAARVSERIGKRRMSFEDAVVEYGMDPGQGAPLELSWNTLSGEVQSALAGLKPSEVSRPVESQGDTFLFQLVARLSASEIDRDLERRARAELERQLRRRAGEELRRELRTRAPVRIHEERLPFRYISEAGA